MSIIRKKIKNSTIKSSSKNKLTSKVELYKPLNVKLSEFRNKPPYSYDEVNNNLLKFLNNNPSKDNLNKLYDTTIYFAESDSIGEDWKYIREFTRELFDILCKIMKIDNLDHIIKTLIAHKYKIEEILLNNKILDFTNKYSKRKNINELVKRYRKQLDKDKKHFLYGPIELQYLIDNKLLNSNEIKIYKSKEYDNRYGGSSSLNEYIIIAFNLLHHLRIL